MGLSVGETAQPGTFILGMRVDPGSYRTATAQIIGWAQRGESRSVCAANVHMVMETRDSPTFRQAVNGADLITSDGMPLVWILRRRGFPEARRVYGPDLMLSVCREAAAANIPVALFGSTTPVLEQLTANLLKRLPDLKVVSAISPAFGELAPAQTAGHLSQLARAGARIIFVGLGCPKQERWMAECRNRIPAVLLGVGAAFNFHAGQVRQSPAWMQQLGLEWIFRLAMEPRRLWRRYAWHNPRFIWAIAGEEWRRRGSFARPAA